MDVLESKICTKCKVEKSLDSFGIRVSRSHDQYYSWCKQCSNENTKRYRESYPDRARTAVLVSRSKRPEYYRRADRNSWLFRKYGITIEQYEAKLLAQDNCCGSCGEPLDFNADRMPPVDHCHDTGMVRDILCPTCNKGLGFFGDDLTKVSKAAEYLRRWSS